MFYPLFWQATVGEAQSFIPLDNVDSFGIQKYLVNGQMVTEFTVALKSQTFIRFYHIAAEDELVAELDRLKGTVTKMNSHVTKTYPVTTHKSMMEYRLSTSDKVKKIKDSFYKTYLDFKMKDFVAEQREESVRQFESKK